MNTKRWICLSAACVTAAALLPLPVRFSSADSAKSDDIVILYTNDVHCAADTNLGYDGLALYKHELEAQYDHVFLVDAGDAIQGAPIGSLSKGKDIISLMNGVGYDVCIPGNHEFDYGMDVLQERSKELKCGYISCNFKDLQKDELVYAPYQILEAGDKKIAFVGVTTPETFSKSTPGYFQNADKEYLYSFSEDKDTLYQTIQDGVDAARKENPDYVILLAHLGETSVTEQWSAKEVLAHTTGIDALIDGHSHEKTESLEVKNADGKTVLVTQTGSKLQNIGQMTISADGMIKTELISIVPKPDSKLNLPEDSWTEVEGKEGKYVDAKLHESLQEINEKLNAVLDQKIGETPFKLYDSDPETGKRRVRTGETNIGDLCADACRSYMEADVAVLNGGGLRSFIEPGDITYREAMAVMPFGNMVCSAKVTGQQILDLLELGAMRYPEENPSFIQVSGMCYAIDPEIESTVKFNDKGEFEEVSGARRVHSVMIGDEPLDPEKTYTLASHDYYLKHNGDGNPLSGNCEILRDDVISESELLAVYIRDTLEGVVPERYRDPAGQGRIRFEKAPDSQQETTEPTETTASTETTSTPAETTAPPTEPPTTQPVTETTAPASETLPADLDPSMLPDWLDPSMLPEGFDLTKIDWSKIPADFDPSMLPADFDWTSLLKDSDKAAETTAGTGTASNTPAQPAETTFRYVVPFILTPRETMVPSKPNTTTSTVQVPAYTPSSYSDSASSYTPGSTPQDDTPYTGERTAAAAVFGAAALAFLTASITRKKH